MGISQECAQIMYSSSTKEGFFRDYLEFLRLNGEREHEKILRKYMKQIEYANRTGTWMHNLYLGAYDVLEGCPKRFNIVFLSRCKSFNSLERKIEKLKASGENLQIEDVFGFKVVISGPKNEVDDTFEVYRTYKRLLTYFERNKWKPIKPKKVEKNNVNLKYHLYIPDEGKIKKILGTTEQYLEDYIRNPKKSGYQALHFTVHNDELDEYIEIQIKTHKMHAFAEVGPASHKRYKSNLYNSKNDLDYSNLALRGFEYEAKEQNINIEDMIQKLFTIVVKNSNEGFTPEQSEAITTGMYTLLKSVNQKEIEITDMLGIESPLQMFFRYRAASKAR